jgi:hypothetical protein
MIIDILDPSTSLSSGLMKTQQLLGLRDLVGEKVSAKGYAIVSAFSVSAQNGLFLG